MAVSDGIDRFKRRHHIQDEVKRTNALSFLLESPSKTTVVLQKNDTNITALIVSSYKEGPNELLLFTYKNTNDLHLPVDQQKNVFIGDYITYNNKTYLVLDEYDHPDFADYGKHKIIECNVMYGYDHKKFGGFYIGSRRKLESLEEGFLAKAVNINQVGEHPLLIVASQDDLKPRKRILINGEAWMIDGIDKNTISNIMFLSIHLDTLTINDDLIEGVTNEPEAPSIDINLLIAGDVVVLDTNFNYIRFDTDVVVISQTESEVEFIVPYNVSTLTVTTKDEAGILVSMTYEVA
jgi:hypothetical protein